MLETERLSLDVFTADDAVAVARLVDDPELLDVLVELPRPYGVEDAARWIGSQAEARASGRESVFAIRLADDGRLVGAVRVTRDAAAWHRASLGYWIGREYRGRGYASEAVRAAADFALGAFGAQRVEARHLQRNPTSGGVLRNAGLVHEAHLASYFQHAGRSENMEQYARVADGEVVKARPRHGIATVTLVVRDYDEARDWFVERLGFRLAGDTALDESNKDGVDKRWLVVEPPGGGGVRLLLARASTASEAVCIGRQAGGRVFLFLETDDFERDHARYLAAGVEFTEAPRDEAYGRVAVFRDLCGNLWDLIEPGG